MSRLLFECTNVFRNPGINSGIQRVVRNIVRHLDSVSDDVECVPVLFAHNRLYRVRQLLPGVEGDGFLARTYASLERLNHSFWGLHGLCEQYWPMRRWHNVRRIFFIIGRIFSLPIALALRVLSWSGCDPLTQRAEPFEAKADDQLILLDSSWHAQHFTLIESLRSQGVRVTAVVYDLIPVTRPEFFEERLRGIFNQWFDWVIHHADGYMSISEAVRNEVYLELCKRLGQQVADRLSHGYFHLGSELDLQHAGQQPLQALCEIFQQESKVFLAVSTIEPRKNHTYLLDAFELAWAAGSQAKLCIIGRIGWKCEALVQRIRQHGEFGRRLFMFNKIDDSGLEYAYKHASALVFSSHAEGFGLPLVEAMQRGLPVMGSDLPVFREIGGDCMAYFDLAHPQELAGLIQCFEATGIFPAACPLEAWSWIDWHASAQHLVAGIHRPHALSGQLNAHSA